VDSLAGKPYGPAVCGKQIKYGNNIVMQKDWRVFALLLPIALVMAFFAFGQKQGSREVHPREVMGKLSQANMDGFAKSLSKDVNSVFAFMIMDGLQVGDDNKTVQELDRKNQTSPANILIYFVI
jgi:hypothetical protein